MYDLLLKGGRIYDGSGMPSYNGDIAIPDGRIVEIGRLNGSAERTLKVDGLAVAPGFIDPHTHLDAQLFWDPMGTSSCFHGVTSVVVGNCGLSLAPAKPEDRDAVMKSFVRVEAISRRVLEQGIEWQWTSTAEYFGAPWVRGWESTSPHWSAISPCATTSWAKTPSSAGDRGRNHQNETARPPRHGSRRRRVFHQSESAPYPRGFKAGGEPARSRRRAGTLLDVLGEMNAGVVQLSGGGTDARGRIEYAAGIGAPHRAAGALAEHLS